MCIRDRGTAPALNDLLAGNVDMMFNELATSIGLQMTGKARILAVTVAKRVPSLPDIPTMEEAGVPDFISDTWHALTAPPKTPADIVAKLNAAADKALADPGLLDAGEIVRSKLHIERAERLVRCV